MSAKTRDEQPGRRGIAAVLRAALMALAFAFAIGFGIGTWIRCEMERPTGYLAARPPPSGAAAAALPLDVGLAGAVVGHPREHKE